MLPDERYYAVALAVALAAALAAAAAAAAAAVALVGPPLTKDPRQVAAKHRLWHLPA